MRTATRTLRERREGYTGFGRTASGASAQRATDHPAGLLESPAINVPWSQSVTQDSAPPASPSLSYRDAGVDIDARLVERIKPLAAATTRPGVITGLGGFGALFELPLADYRQPVLVSGTDGVGTKLKLAIDLGRHDSIGRIGNPSHPERPGWPEEGG
jgi:hypothetical protein